MTLFNLHRRHLPSLQCSIRIRAHWDGERQGEICAAPYGGPRHFGAFDPVVGISNMLSNGLAFRIHRAQNLFFFQRTDMQAQRGGAQKQVIVTSSLLGHTERETNGKDRAKANSSTCVSSAPGTSNLCCPPTATRSAFAGPDTHCVCAKMLQNAVLARLAIRHTTCRQAQGHHDVSVLDTWHNQVTVKS